MKLLLNRCKPLNKRTLFPKIFKTSPIPHVIKKLHHLNNIPTTIASTNTPQTTLTHYNQNHQQDSILFNSLF